MELNINKLKASLAYILILILYNLILLFVPNDKFELWVKILAIFSIFHFLINTAFFVVFKKKLVSVAYVFVALSFLFHLGQVVLHAFFKGYNYISADFIKMYPEELTKNALLFSFNIIQIVSIFILLSTDTKEKKKSRKPRFNKINNLQLKMIGWIICIITVPMKYIYIRTAIRIVQDETYVRSTVEGFSGVYIQISNFSIIAFVILLFAYSYNKVIQKAILLFALLFFLWGMLSGGRIYSVISILILFLCYARINCSKISFKSVLIIVAFAVLFLQLVTAITYVRTTHDFHITNLIQYAFQPSNNFLLKVLDEFGGTIGTVIFAFDEIPRNIEFHKGFSYIKSWMLVGLNINGVLNQISKEIAYPVLFSRKFNLGGSYIGELYYNFGYFSYFFAPFVGVFIGKLSELSEYCLNNRLVVELALLVMPIYGSILWIRGYFDSFTRASVWGAIFILILYFICSRLTFRRSQKYTLNQEINDI